MRILFVEDDDELAAALEGVLREEGYDVVREADGAVALYRAREWPFDAIVLDLMLPNLDGRAFLRELRTTHDTPVLVLTAKRSLSDRVESLDEGADDYLCKPFELDELLARLRALLRRPRHRRGLTVHLGDVAVDLDERCVRRSGEPVETTPFEFRLLEALVLERGRVVPRRRLEDRLFPESDPAESNSLEVLVSRLRRKLGRSLIATRRGVGYGVDLE